MAIEDDGVPGIVPAGVPRDVVKRRSHIVYDFPFAFIAPLRADYHHCLSRRLIHLSGHPEPFQAAQSPVKVVREALQEGCCSKGRKPSYAALGVKARVVRGARFRGHGSWPNASAQVPAVRQDNRRTYFPAVERFAAGVFPAWASAAALLSSDKKARWTRLKLRPRTTAATTVRVA